LKVILNSVDLRANITVMKILVKCLYKIIYTFLAKKTINEKYVFFKDIYSKNSKARTSADTLNLFE